MFKIAESTRSAEDEINANKVLLEELKKQKRVLKTQLTKLYTQQMRLMPDDTIIDREAIFTALENLGKKNGCDTNFRRPDNNLRQGK